MFVGYADDSAADAYRFYDPKTERIKLSQDVTWLNTTYGTWKGIKMATITKLDEDLAIKSKDRPKTDVVIVLDSDSDESDDSNSMSSADSEESLNE